MAELRLQGRSAAPGLARGAVAVLDAPTAGSRPGPPVGTPDEECTALLAALDKARADTEALAASVAGDAADMLMFQAAMLADDELARPALAAIAAGAPAAAAWEHAIAAEADGYAGGDAVLAARTADLQDLRDRVAAHLRPGGAAASSPPCPPGSVVVAADLPLSRFLLLDWSGGGAIVLTEGSPASHVAMLARSRRVPMVVGVGNAAPLQPGQEALVDATVGEVVLNPDEATRRAFAARTSAEADARRWADAFSARPAATRDGTRIAVCFNIGGPGELDGLDPAGCDGIGLVRTELLFQAAATPAGAHAGLPDEDAQFAAYRRIAEWAGERSATVRVLDAGGDKPIPGVTPHGESNPFLGLRGLRLLLRAPDLFRTQLRALARAAAHGNLRVMLPMVTVPGEFAAARTLLDEEVAALQRRGVPARRPPLGIMVEVPTAAISIGRFTGPGGAEFLSIGSNDLTQYVAAAGRDIGSVADLLDPLDPAVLSLVEGVARHGRSHGMDVSLCGDAAAEPRCIPALLRAGLRSLSVAPDAVGGAKEAIAATDLGAGGRGVPQGMPASGMTDPP